MSLRLAPALLFALILNASAAPAEEPPARFKVGDTFNQQVIVSRRSAFQIVGLDVVKWAQYSFVSSFAITKVNEDGSLEAQQTIKAARLIDADPDLRAPMAAALLKTQGVKLELTVRPNGDVATLKAPKVVIQVQMGGDVAVGQSLRLWSLLDADAWKELDGRTFFLPEKPLRSHPSLAQPPDREPWTRDLVHDWGALGSWSGKTIYADKGKERGKKDLERIEYRHDITYKSPAKGADRDHPLRVLKTEFKPLAAGGVMLFDPAARKVAVVEETFRVRGTALVSLGGTEATIDMEELQGFRINVAEPAVKKK